MRSELNGLIVESLTSAEAARVIPSLARLRIEVFRAFPYLYDGSPEYEEKYLAAYAGQPRAVIVTARPGGGTGGETGHEVVGAATALPLADAVEEEKAPFRRAGWPIDDICYFGESVLLPEWRGRGAGVAFFDHREAHARSLGLARAVFCAVDRPGDHPRRPPGHVPLDEFWRRRGYERVPLETTFSWRDLDEDRESPKRMLFWTKDLTGSEGRN